MTIGTYAKATKAMIAVAFVLAGGAATAETTSGPQPVGNGSTPTAAPADPGRPVLGDAERGGLSGRGGPGAAGTSKTYSATIGSIIYSTIGSTIGSQLPASR